MRNSPPRTIVVSKQTGRLCNRLQLYGVMIAAGRELGATVHNPAFEDYSDFFEGPAASSCPLSYKRARLLYQFAKVCTRLRLPGLRARRARSRCYVDMETLPAERWRILVTQGLHFYADHWGETHAEAIRAYLRPTLEFRRQAEGVVSSAREQGDFVIGVHIRGTDYQDFFEGRFCFSLDQYAQIVRGFASQMGGRRAALVLCSDEAVVPEAFAPLPALPGPGSVIGDLHALSLCDYLIGPPSSFNSWAAFHGNRPLYQIHDPAHTPTPGDFRLCPAPGSLRLQEGIRPC